MSSTQNFQGTNFKYYREINRMTQEALAERLGVVRSQIAQYERGSRSPSIQVLREMADIFEVSIDELLGRKSIT